ncbi:solute carrier family 25 member 53 [Astyanax mexicanus]|uniref:solute carrier family 25 member 53 n=1 Tax=Astyanax mexicanus TaxID=7994 RepID=UPI0020CB1699|nr:solute carrier family 25 member 53 [Astyanax mexicanus]
MGWSPANSDKEQHQKDADPTAWFRKYKHGGTSSLISTLTTVMTFPIYKTVFRQQLHSSGFRETVAQLNKEGPLKLYRGVAPPLLMKTLNGTLLFGLQGTLLQRLSRAESILPGTVLPALAGLGAGVVEALIFTPFERVQNILQNSGNDRSLPTIRSILVRLRSENLAQGFYRAFLPILARNALGSSLYFGLKDPVSSALREQGLSPVASSFFSGVFNSMVISLPLYPMSVLVANMQAKVGEEKLGLRASMQKLWRARQCSLILLYRGGSLVILRSCISWGITTAIYDRLENRTN